MIEKYVIDKGIFRSVNLQIRAIPISFVIHAKEMGKLRASSNKILSNNLNELMLNVSFKTSTP